MKQQVSITSCDDSEQSLTLVLPSILMLKRMHALSQILLE